MKIKDKLELSIIKNSLILKPKSEPRSGCGKSFKEMHENGDDKLLINDFFEDENLEIALTVKKIYSVQKNEKYHIE